MIAVRVGWTCGRTQPELARDCQSAGAAQVGPVMYLLRKRDREAPSETPHLDRRDAYSCVCSRGGTRPSLSSPHERRAGLPETLGRHAP
jgi:hypothetical protein